MDVTCSAHFVFLGCTGHIFHTPSMILSFLRAVSSQITSRGCCMDCAFSMPWSRNDAHLGRWDGTLHMSSMRQTYALVLCSYTCFLMSVRYVSGKSASDLIAPWWMHHCKNSILPPFWLFCPRWLCSPASVLGFTHLIFSQHLWICDWYSSVALLCILCIWWTYNVEVMSACLPICLFCLHNPYTDLDEIWNGSLH
jgi:hypothetical protein